MKPVCLMAPEVLSKPAVASGAKPTTIWPDGLASALLLLRSRGYDLRIVAPGSDELAYDNARELTRIGIPVSAAPREHVLTELVQRGACPFGSAIVETATACLDMAASTGIATFDAGKGWPETAADIVASARRATVQRITRETDIDLTLSLDGTGRCTVQTGVEFFDHMLDQLATHGGFNLIGTVSGDTGVDAHHTVEDVAICLGTAFDRALGARAGVGRYGFTAPMDETCAHVAVDLSGRPLFVHDVAFKTAAIGALPTSMVPHFWRSFTDHARITMHASATGDDDHHLCEGLFKAAARALRQAVSLTGAGGTPSTKGSL